MVRRVSIRELRNQTSAVVASAADEEIIVTNHGRDMAILQAIAHGEHSLLDEITADLPAPIDTGLLDELTDDDLSSMADLD